MESLLLVLIVLACPLMMLMMMRGHRGDGHHGDAPLSGGDLRRRRAELDRELAAREHEDR